MARAKLTTKNLAQRIDLEYFKHPHPFRRLRFILSVALPVLALLWLGWYALARNNRIYSGGRMSASHAVLTARCSACHVAQAGVFSARASDQGCDSCHDAPAHHANQIFTPACAACHAEHRGHPRLAVTADVSCTQCHANLHTSGAATHFTADITRFNGGHPEFAALRRGQQRSRHDQAESRDTPETQSARAEWSGATRLRRLPSHGAAGIALAVRFKRRARSAGEFESARDSAVHGCGARLHVSGDLRETLRRVPRIAIRCAFSGRRAARYSRSDPHVSGAKVSAIYSQSSGGVARNGSEPQSSAPANPARGARAHRAAVGGVASGGIGRTPLAEDVRAMPRAKVCGKRATACRREIQYHAALVSARRVQSRYAQAFEMRGMSWRRADQPGNRGRAAAGDRRLARSAIAAGAKLRSRAASSATPTTIGTARRV